MDSVTLNLLSAPDVSGLSNWREATEGNLVPLDSVTVKDDGGSVKLSDIEMSDDVPARFFLTDVKSTY